jgi:hypothetical protein
MENFNSMYVLVLNGFEISMHACIGDALSATVPVVT